ncbi:MAG TPA: hypothetical protein PLN33_13130 [Hyphomonadaceae bacterium]|nr:hypothetical protein [Hyphomonadaceae bacterium]HPN07181.1 hypothetical protein [Hyphomonadaceae bacterium]
MVKARRSIERTLGPIDGPLKIFYSHPFYMIDDWQRVHRQLDIGWADCYVKLAPNKFSILEASRNLHADIQVRVLEADVLLVPARPLREERRGWIRFELATAQSFGIPILPISFEYGGKTAKWIIERAGRPQIPIANLRAEILKALPIERKYAFEALVFRERKLLNTKRVSA